MKWSIGAAAVLALLALGSPAGAEHGTPGTTQLISRPTGLDPVPAPKTGDNYLSEDLQGNIELPQRTVSGDGTKVVFASNADGLSIQDDNHYRNIFVYDRSSHTLTLVSRATGASGAAADNDSFAPTISKDGKWVAFVSLAGNLDADVLNRGFSEVYVRHLESPFETELVSRPDAPSAPVLYNQSDQPSISFGADSKVRVAFSTYAPFSSGDTNHLRDVYLRNVTDGTTTLVSRADGASGNVGTYPSQDPAISADGTAVAFDSSATEFIAVDTNGHNRDVFVRVLSSDSTVLVDRTNGALGTQATGESAAPSISDDGTKVAFQSTGAIDGDDSGGGADAYVRDLSAGTTTLASRRAWTTGAASVINQGDLFHPPAISGDGTKVVFESDGANIETSTGPNSNYRQLYVRDLGGGTVTLVSRASDGVSPGDPAQSDSVSPAASTDGNLIVFDGKSANLATDDDNDFRQVFLRNVTAGTTENVSRPDASSFVGPGVGHSDSIYPAGVSADGRYVVFTSHADWLSPDANPKYFNVFVRDTVTNTTTLVSRATDGTAANRDSEAGGISADGTKVVFFSSATNLVAGFTCADYYVRDLVSNQTTVVGPPTDGCTGLATIDNAGNRYTANALISGDGTKVAFATFNPIDPADPAFTLDVYEQALGSSTITLVDRADGPAGARANSGYTNLTGINSDGSRVVFETTSDNVDPGSTAGTQEVFARDTGTDHTYLVSRTSSGAAVDNYAFGGGISADGNRVVFTTYSNTVTPDAPYGDGVFVRDIAAGTTRLASRADGAGGIQANGQGEVLPASISADGNRVTFVTDAGNLGVAYAAYGSNVYVRDLTAEKTTLVSHQAADANTVADYPSQHATISGNGDCVAFVSRADNLIPGYTGGTDFQNVYLGTVSRECPVVAPDTTLDSGPTGTISTRTAVFTFSKDDSTAHFECKLDSGAFAACSSPYTTPALADGSHTFTVRAVDPAGYVDPTPPSRAFGVDATPPQTTITSGPGGLVNSRTASFRFAATEASSFKCSLDGGTAIACASPKAYTGLADGSHTFAVVATDVRGNRDATPASRGWRVDATAPGPSLSVPKQKLGAVLRKGLKLKLGATETVTYALTVQIVGSTKLFGQRASGQAAGQALVTIKPLAGAKKVLRTRRSATLLIKLIDVDTAGNPSLLVTRRVKLKR